MMKTKTIFELAKTLDTPKKVQEALRKFEYNTEPKGETLCSAKKALKRGVAHCFEAAFISAAILEYHGYEPLILSLESKDGLDHVLYLYREKNKWGTISRSRDEGLHGRPPVYKTLEQLARSYYAPYADGIGEVISYQVAHLDELGCDWRTGDTNLWRAEQFLIDLKHIRIRTPRERYKKLSAQYKKRGPITHHKNWW